MCLLRIDCLETKTDKVSPIIAGKMSGAEGNADQSSGKEAQGACGSGEPQESLEDLLRELNKGIKSSDWLEKNTADKWLAENPEAAKDLQYLVDERDAARKQSESSSQPTEKQ